MFIQKWILDLYNLISVNPWYLKTYNKYNICIEGFKHYLLLGSNNNLGNKLVIYKFNKFN